MRGSGLKKTHEKGYLQWSSMLQKRKHIEHRTVTCSRGWGTANNQFTVSKNVNNKVTYVQCLQLKE